MATLSNKGRMWKRRWLSLSRRRDERWILLLSFWCCFFFSSSLPSLHPLLVSLLLVQETLWAPAVSQSAGLLRQSSTWFSMITVIVCAPVHAACRLDGQLMRGKKRGGNCTETSKSGLHRGLPVMSAFSLKFTSLSALEYTTIHHKYNNSVSKHYTHVGLIKWHCKMWQFIFFMSLARPSFV